MSTNDITGDTIVTKTTSTAYAENYDRVFRAPRELKTEEKKTVHYRPPYQETIRVGYSAHVVPIDHSNSVAGQSVTNGHVARTSEVIAYDEETGNFETLDALYVLAPHD